jgi:hypothetical protein
VVYIVWQAASLADAMGQGKGCHSPIADGCASGVAGLAAGSLAGGPGVGLAGCPPVSRVKPTTRQGRAVHLLREGDQPARPRCASLTSDAVRRGASRGAIFVPFVPYFGTPFVGGASRAQLFNRT